MPSSNATPGGRFRPSEERKRSDATRSGTSQSIRALCDLRPRDFEAPLCNILDVPDYPGWTSFDAEWKRYSLSEFLPAEFKVVEEQKETKRKKAKRKEAETEEALEAALPRDPFSDGEQESQNSKPESPVNSSKKPSVAKQLATQVIAWLKHDSQQGFSAREGVLGDFHNLSPLLNSTRILADVVFVRDIWPLICFGIHSAGLYQDTVAKLIAVCIDHLRLMMNGNRSITETCGFVLPMESEKSAVTEVWVVWREFKFDIKFRLLSIDAARLAIAQRKAQMQAEYPTELRGKYPQDFTLLPLTLNDLEAFGDPASVVQIRSNSAIVVHNRRDKLFYKWNHSSRVHWDLSTATSKIVVKPLPTRKFCGQLDFRVFPEVDRSLSTPRSIREHRFEYVWRLYEALVSVHTQDKQAHLDVRIENTCFGVNEATGERQLLLIDFDRSELVTTAARGVFDRYPSNMYQGQPQWTCGKLDFKQMGLLIASALDDSFDTEKPFPLPASSPLTVLAPLLHALIQRGEWDQAAFDTWSATKMA